MNNKKISGFSLLLCILVFNSCTDDPLQVGFELLPETDLLETNADTLSIKGYTVKGRSGTSYSNTGTQNYVSFFSSIGHVIDPIFGESWAEATMQLNYGDSHYELDTNVLSATYRSCKLYLKINEETTFGGEDGFDLEIFTLNNLISHTNKTDYSIKSEDFDINNIVSTSTEHNLFIDHNDITDLDSGNYYLVIEIEESYASSLMDTAFINANNLYLNESYFYSQFPGIYIRANATNGIGGIETFYFGSSHLVLEYDWEVLYADENGDDSIVTETKYNTFDITRYQSLYRHQSNFSPEGPFGNFLGDTIISSDQIYVQSLGGSRGFINIPELETLRLEQADSIGINLAEMVLPVNTELCDTVGFYLPPRITLMSYYPLYNYWAPVVDDNSNLNSYPEYFSGYLDKEKMEYRINITEYVHRVVYRNAHPNWLYVVASKLNLNTFSNIDYNNPGRAIIQTENGTNNAFLRIIYTNTIY